MPFVRNPFRKQDENARPHAIETVEKNGSNKTQNAEIIEKHPAEYMLSDINDSGVCLQPSPVERKSSFWGHTNSSWSTTSSNHRSLINESEQFNISRESFDSYRRSFDISGRSPIMRPNEYAQQRASLDSRSIHSQPPRISSSKTRPGPVPVMPPAAREEDFEDVGLEDAKPHHVKKKGIFSRLTDSAHDQHSPHHATDRPSSSHEKSSWHHFGPGRKRGQSGQGAELASYPDQVSPQRENTPRPTDQALNKPNAPNRVETAQAPAL